VSGVLKVFEIAVHVPACLEIVIYKRVLTLVKYNNSETNNNNSTITKTNKKHKNSTNSTKRTKGPREKQNKNNYKTKIKTETR